MSGEYSTKTRQLSALRFSVLLSHRSWLITDAEITPSPRQALLKTAPGRTRTCDPRFRKPVQSNVNPCQHNTPVSGAAPRAAASAQNTPSASDSLDPNRPDDADLAAVVEAWADLPDAVRAGITAMVKVARG